MYFSNIQTLEELKKSYRSLAKNHHPDMGGDEEMMKKIVYEYEEKVKELLIGEEEKIPGFKETNETMEAYKDIIDELIKYRNINIEICGTWLWISGEETKQVKEKLKTFGCFWARKKKMWYYRPAEYKCFNRKTKSMDEIRRKYGSQKIRKAEKSKSIGGKK